MRRFDSRLMVSGLAALVAACGAQPEGEDPEMSPSGDDPGQSPEGDDPEVGTLSAAATAPICTSATTGSGWVGKSIGTRAGTFTVNLDATPSVSPSDALFGLSNGVA